MSGVLIRVADEKDAELIANISRLTFFETFAVENTKENMNKFMNEQFSKEKLMAEVGAPGNIFLLAMDEEGPAGYVRMKETEQNESLGRVTAIEISRIYAMPHKIGKGVGHLLMQSSIEMAKKMNKKIIWLAVWEKNLRGISFYKKWGFERFGEHDFILGDDVQLDWLMKKDLSQ